MLLSLQFPVKCTVFVHISYSVAIFRLLLACLFCKASLLMDRVRLIRLSKAMQITFTQPDFIMFYFE